METVHSVASRVYLVVRALRDREEGQALVEYALLLSLIAIVSVAVLTALGTNVSTIFSNINANI